MKTFRILPIMLAAVLLFSSCGRREVQNTSVTSGNNDITIVTSFYPMYIFTKNIVKDIEGVNVVNMAEPQTGCLHDYHLNPADLKKIEKADIMVINGAGMETFIEKIIDNRPQIKIIEASKGLELIKEDGHHEEDEHEHEVDKHEGHDHSVNPHLWVSISGAIDEVKNICEQLKNADANNAKKYQSNTDEYVQKLETQKEKMHNALKDIANRNIVTFHRAFPYFAKEFDLDIVEVIETDEGSSPSAGELSDKIKKIKQSNVKALFSEPQVSSNLAQTVSNETGIKVYKIDTVVTGPDEPELDYYEKIMDKNLNVLLEALK